jgi:DHA3 family multidrug efflux protein-like MFS transporter
MRLFYLILGNTVLASITNTFAWFALVFFAYLETNSVMATSIIGGAFLTLTALSGIFFGTFVDHHPKRMVMLISSSISLVCYAIAGLVYLSVPDGAFSQVFSPALLALIALIVMGSVSGNARMIALSTSVTLLVPEERRANANGLVGAGNGVSFSLSSIISGLLIGWYGMGAVLLLSVLITFGVVLHLLTIRYPREVFAHEESGEQKSMDLRGTIAAILAVPGFMMLIFFTTFNNFLGGVFMALMDAYGLSLMSVESWGLVLGVVSPGFILSGLAIAKWGLGKNPLRTLLMVNVVMWSVCIFFVIQPWIVLLLIGMLIWMCLSPVIEATEHTIIQKIIPYERQGRVFGFAQSVEQTASPLTAFLIGPIAQYLFIPFMTTGAGVALIGGWFGTGPARGIALVFIAAGFLGLFVTLYAFRSRSYRLLSMRYQEANIQQKISI